MNNSDLRIILLIMIWEQKSKYKQRFSDASRIVIYRVETLFSGYHNLQRPSVRIEGFGLEIYL